MKNTLFFLWIIGALHAAQPQDMSRYYALLQEQIDLQTKRVDEAALVENTLNPAKYLQFQLSVQQLEAKTALVQNFIGAPSLKSAKVRDALLRIVSMDEMTRRDLIELQSLVDLTLRQQNAELQN